MILPLALFAVLLCCLMPVLFLEGSYLPFKICRPIGYPDGSRIKLAEGKLSVQQTNDSINFFDDALPTHVSTFLGTDLGQWQKRQTDANIVYACYGHDINLLTTETGCIYVRAIDGGTRVEYVRFRSEGGHTPCPKN